MTATGSESRSSPSSAPETALAVALPAAHPHADGAPFAVDSVPQHAAFADGSQQVVCAAGLQHALGSDIASLLPKGSNISMDFDALATVDDRWRDIKFFRYPVRREVSATCSVLCTAGRAGDERR
jgi:hypothetical protein